MHAIEKMLALLEKAKDLPEGEERTKLLNEVKDLQAPAEEEIEISERLLRIQIEHTFNIHSED